MNTLKLKERTEPLIDLSESKPMFEVINSKEINDILRDPPQLKDMNTKLQQNVNESQALMQTIRPFEPLRLETKSVSDFKDSYSPILS